MPRLYDADAGAVRFGGVDVRDLSFDDIRAAVGVVTQDGHLFHDTIRANLAYAAPDADRRRAVGRRCAAPAWPRWCASLPDGLDTVVGERGYRLSGGERQRLTIARLLLAQPRVVILDEATAHLDSESEVAVQEALAAALDRSHRARHRPPAVDDPRGRRHPRGRGRPGRRARHPRRAPRRGRSLRRALPHPVRRRRRREERDRVEECGTRLRWVGGFVTPQPKEETLMGETIDQAKGRVKQAAGDLTDDKDLKAEGKGDELLGKAKGTLDDIRDKAEDHARRRSRTRSRDIRDKH